MLLLIEMVAIAECSRIKKSLSIEMVTIVVF